MRLAKARLKPSHELPEWDNCCEEGRQLQEELASEWGTFDIDLDKVSPYSPALTGHCGQELHYGKAVMVVRDGKHFGWVPIEMIEIDEGEPCPTNSKKS